MRHGSDKCRSETVRRFGVTNIYLKIGLALLILGVVLAAALWFTMPWEQPGGGLLGWATRASFLGGIVLYLIGRLVHASKRSSKA